MTNDTSETASKDPTEVSASFFTSTETFRISPSVYLKISAKKSRTLLRCALALPVAGCFTGAVFDLRWAFVGLILTMLVYPTLIAYVYYTRLLTAEAHRAVSPKKIEIHAPERIDIIYVSADDEAEPLSVETIGWPLLQSAAISRGRLLISIEGCRNPLVIPVDSFRDADDVNKLCSMIGNTVCRQA